MMLGDRPFRFEVIWLRHLELRSEVKRCWSEVGYGANFVSHCISSIRHGFAELEHGDIWFFRKEWKEHT